IIFIFTICTIVPNIVLAEGRGSVLSRHKREWVIPPPKLKENVDYTTRDHIAKIRSDVEYKAKVTYSLLGPGADQDPIGLFTVNADSGLVRINGILDRETTPLYKLLGVAKYNNGSRAERDIELQVIVLDENDCPPVFKKGQIGSVNESSAAGTYVMKVFATDADEPGTPHSEIYYSIVEKTASDRMFSINSRTGEITVRQTGLDRETQQTHHLTIQGADMNGQGGNTGTGEIVINLLDINDNIPTLENEYEGKVEENTINVEVIRIKAVDLDLMYTDNWLAVFHIISGNEAGYFSITTDSNTNEGIIMIHKPLDYEELKVINLMVTVSNKAEYNFGAGTVVPGIDITQKPYPIKINVINQKEGPRFHPAVKVVTISEDKSTVSINKVITNYAAIDSDTLQIATNVRYAKIHDADNWLIIDEKTGDIKLNKLPDRESKFLINGTYFAKIICITNELPSKTATGTIAIQVEDFNDHCPTLTTTTQTMCDGDNVVYVTAIDQDEFPNSAPFHFSVINEKSDGKWTVEHLNDTTAILRDHANLWPGTYKVAVEIRDQQGKSCANVQEMDVIVCTCHEDTKTCVARKTSSSSFGASGILLLLLGLLLLLLVPLLLLFCLCGGAAALGNFKPIPFEAKEQLISYHTEGQGEDKNKNVDIIEAVLTSPVSIYLQKANHAAMQSQQRDALLVYDYEGQESLAGSVGCCSLLENDDDLEFLNDLGPKFRTLAEICSGSALVTESVNLGASVPPPRPVSPAKPSTSSHTHVHTHTETIRDRDHVNINTLNTSNVASGSSTIIQEKRFSERGQGSAPIPKVHVQDNIVIPSQTLLIQQPTMYYAATPMYVVEPKPQMVLVGGATQHAVGQVGLSPGLVQVGGIQGSQGLVLVEGQVGVGGVAGQIAPGFSQGSISRSKQVLVVENGSASSGVGSATGLTQAILQTGQMSSEQGLEVRGHGAQMTGQSVSLGASSQRGSAGSDDDILLTATPMVEGSQTVVVQHKKVSVTERNIETRA
uniref:Desmoglein 2 n=1 Tax=Myripristis murdjan TaxID=586833 RepID=A0A668AI05_9TELE